MTSGINPTSSLPNTLQNTEAARTSFDSSLSSQNMRSARPAPTIAPSRTAAMPTSYSNPTVSYEHSVAFQSKNSTLPMGNSVTITAERTPDTDKKSSKAGLLVLGGIVLGVGGIVGGIAGSYATNPENKDRPPGSGR